ncbi:TPA: hypothetical protein HNC65_07435 [Escherichia coli]|nr:hypothetical protein BWI83_18750 [Escherichia coli]EFN7554311.1 hypothetical protein [Escherichia coli]MQI43213.1 hypothetical protein [Escherichia coli]OYI57735.1 hypothetical protein CI693_08025 [Escherichia coli]RZW24999.1 hypothetical protein EXX80_03215 [Escherichia coli]
MFSHPVYLFLREFSLQDSRGGSERPKGQGITGADHFWFGHTPLRHRVDIGNLHYIDTGAVFGGELTLVQLQ